MTVSLTTTLCEAIILLIMENSIIKKCLYCGQLLSGSKFKKYCNISCSSKYYQLRKTTPKPKIEKNCKQCGKAFLTHPSYKFCSQKCSVDWRNNAYTNTNLTQIPSSTVGAIAEIIVSAELMKRGFEVYRAMSPASYSDLIAISGDNIYKIEVRTGRYRKDKDGNLILSYPPQRTENKKIAVYTHNDKKIHFIDDWLT